MKERFIEALELLYNLHPNAKKLKFDLSSADIQLLKKHSGLFREAYSKSFDA